MDHSLDTTQFGVHYMLDGYNGAPSILSDKQKIEELLATLPQRIGMHPITSPIVIEAGPNNKKDPGGISGFVMIAESHISIHTFPKRGFVSVDTYTCTNELDTEQLTKEFTEFFALGDSEMHVIARGTKYPVENIYP